MALIYGIDYKGIPQRSTMTCVYCQIRKPIGMKGLRRKACISILISTPEGLDPVPMCADHFILALDQRRKWR